MNNTNVMRLQNHPSTGLTYRSRWLLYQFKKLFTNTVQYGISLYNRKNTITLRGLMQVKTLSSRDSKEPKDPENKQPLQAVIMKTLCDFPLNKVFRFQMSDSIVAFKRLVEVGCVPECEYQVVFKLRGVTIISNGHVKIAIDNETAQQIMVI